jgi:protein involved in polysaccharide export with SLBB domain
MTEQNSRYFSVGGRGLKTRRATAIAGTSVLAFLCSALPAAAAINAGDRLNVHVYNHPELSTLATVDSSGSIQLPVVGTVRVAGLDSKDVASAIRERIKPYVPFPDVDVQDTSESQTIFITGAPGGVLPYSPNETLSAAVGEIAKATKFSDTDRTPPNAQLDQFDRSRLDLKRVGLIRGGKSLGVFDMIALRNAGNPGPALYANDTVAFANKPVSVSVQGAVNTPGSAYLWPDEPLSDAIAQAGGPSATAASGHIVVAHPNGSADTLAQGDPLFNAAAQSGDVVTIPTAPRVTMAGLVEHPGVVSLQNDFTLLSAVAAAGGYNKFGDLRKVQLIHAGVRTEYNMVALAHGDKAQNPELHDGDTVFVPEGHKTDWFQVFQGLGALGSVATFGRYIAP